MAYKFQFGQAILSGALDQEGDVQIKDQSGNTKVKLDDNGIISGAGNFQTDGALVMSDVTRISAAGAGSFAGVAAGGAISTATSIDGSGDLTMGTITMTGFAVDADGDTALKSLAVDDSSTIGCDSDTDLLTLAAQSITVAADSALTYKGTAITSTGAELNLVDGSSAGTVVASKAVIYDAAGQINSNGLTGSLRFSLDVAADGGLGMTPFQNTANVNDLKMSGSFMPATAAVLASESFVGLSASGSVKQFSIADLATAQAGDGLAASSGVLSVGVDDSSIEINSDALRLKDDGITGAKLAPAVAGVGLAQDGSGNLDLDLNELTAAAVNVANDSIAIIDADDSNASKKESIVDFVSGIAGAGLSAASGQLSVQGNTVTAITDGTAVAEGYNFATGSDGASVTLPASPSVGDVVTVKNSSAGEITLTRGDAGHDIDGESAILLESPFAAVTCVYMVANKWKIV